MATTLTQEIAKLKSKYGDAQGTEYSAAVDLGARIEDGNQRVYAELEAIIKRDGEWRQAIHGQVLHIATVVGLLPAPQEPLSLNRPPDNSPPPKVIRDEQVRQAALNAKPVFPSQQPQSH